MTTLASSMRDRLPAFMRANPLFDRAWYVAHYPDTAHVRLGAYAHYHRHGWREGRNPSPWFDTTWYLATYADVAAADSDPLDHYLRFGAAEARQPGPHFDAARYLHDNADVASGGLNPLLHYLRHGQREGRVIHALPDYEPLAELAAPSSASPSAPDSPLDAALGYEAADTQMLVAGRAGLWLVDKHERTTRLIDAPTSDEDALFDIEYGRALGATLLLVTPAGRPWVDAMPVFRTNLDRWYARAGAALASRAWDLSRPNRWSKVRDLVDSAALLTKGIPSILAWHVGQETVDLFDDYRVFEPPPRNGILPYLDRSIDVVLCGSAEPADLIEARRVAVFAVASGSTPAPSIWWQSDELGHGPRATMVLRGYDSRTQTLIAEHLPTFVAVGTSGSADHVVVLGPNILPLPNSVRGLLRVAAARPDIAVLAATIIARSDGPGRDGHRPWTGLPRAPQERTTRATPSPDFRFAAIRRESLEAARTVVAGNNGDGVEFLLRAVVGNAPTSAVTDEAIGILFSER